MCGRVAGLSEGELRLLSIALRLRVVGRTQCHATKTIVLLERFPISPHTKRRELVTAAVRLL